MKEKSPRSDRPQKQRDSTENGGRAQRPNINMSVPWGRGASEYRPGIFVKQFFLEHGEACAADIYYALSREIERLNVIRIEISEKPFQRPNYSSFARYFHWFKLLGLVEPTGRQEPATYHFLKQRVFYKLTAEGAVEEAAWCDPIRIAHPELA